ncbi:MAG TPA: hypothetical protein VJN92_24215 [Candidatus Acidoferrum sp.]|nr:hypothetical protein [Candidatus Acidoferrum sp.]
MLNARILIAVLLTLNLLTGLSYAQAPQPNDRVQGWSADIDFLLDQASKQHYVYKSKPLPERMVEGAASLKKNIPNFSDERMLAELQRLISTLGDGHSYVLPFGAEHVHATWLPVRFYLLSDGLFIIDAQPGYENWIGAKVVRLGGISATEAMSRVGVMISQDNSMGTVWIGPILLRFRGVLEAVEATSASNTLDLSLVDASGRRRKASLPYVPVPQMRGLPKLMASKAPHAEGPPLYLSNVSTNYWFKELSDGRAIYFQFNQVADADDESLSACANRLGAALTANPPQLLVIDVRHNNGGNADLLPQLLDGVKKFESNNPQAKIVVITGRNTFSAAQIFINLMNRDTKAIFAGEPSSSKPNFVGEENQILFPWSGAMGSISNRHHESMPGDNRQWIEPQIKVGLSSRDYLAGRDPVLETVLTRYLH